MTYVKIVDGQVQIGNAAGVQVTGSNEPGQAGLSPRELLEAAVAFCVAKSIRAVLDRDQVAYDPDELAVEAAATKDEEGANRFAKLSVRVKLPAHLDEAYRKKLLTIAERSCTIGNTLRHGASVETEEM